MSSVDIGFISYQQLLLSSQDSIYSTYGYKDLIMTTERKFRYIRHTADIAFIAYGSTLAKALENATLAMIDIMFDSKKSNAANARIKRVALTERAESTEDLVWFTLQNILTKVQVGNFVPIGFKTSSLSVRGKKSIRGVLLYKDISATRYGLLEVKAVTPHDLKVSKTEKEFSIRVVVDI